MKLARPPRAASLWMLAIVSLLSACGGRPLAGVGVKNLASELVFGIPPLPEAVAPVNTIPEFGPSLDFPSSRPSDGPRGGPQPLLTGPECNDAEVGAAPSEVVPDSIKSLPKAGTYSYRYFGRVTKTDRQLQGFEQRSVREVTMTDPAGPNFTFIVNQRAAGVAIDVTSEATFMVNQTAPSQRLPGARDVESRNVSSRGVFLTRIDRTITTAAGKTRDSFVANPPLKYIDLPAKIGEDSNFDTTAVDPSKQTVIQHLGGTKNRKAVDACGTLIDSWYVEASQVVSGPDGRRFITKLNYGVAFQMGGLIILEHIEFPAQNPDYILDFSVASTGPTG